MLRVSRRGWGLLVPVVGIGAGMLFTTTAATADGTELRTPRGLELSQVVEQRRQDVDRLDRDARALRTQVATATDRLAGAGTGAGAPDALRMAAGVTPVTGAGLSVTLDDAPRPVAGATLPGNPSPDDLLVHQQDVQAVVNALWAGGADAMTLMGRRVVATTAVRCVGNTLLLYGQPYSPPFTIAAIGDPARLRAALAAAPDVQVYTEYVAAYGLGYDVRTERRLSFPAYSGSLPDANRAAP